MKATKKTLSLMTLVLALVLTIAASAYAAADQTYQFWNAAGTAYSPHASSFINGPASVDGSDVTINLHGDYYDYIRVNGGSPIYPDASSTSSNTVFKFTAPSTTGSFPFVIYVNDPSHSGEVPVTFVWIP